MDHESVIELANVIVQVLQLDVLSAYSVDICNGVRTRLVPGWEPGLGKGVSISSIVFNYRQIAVR